MDCSAARRRLAISCATVIDPSSSCIIESGVSITYWYVVSPLATFINDNKFHAICMIGSIIPPSNISVMDSIPSTAPYRNDDLKIYNNNFQLAYSIIKANKNDDKPIHGICEQKYTWRGSR